MREFKRVALDGKGGDIVRNEVVSPRDFGESPRYTRPRSQFASENADIGKRGWKGSEKLTKSQTGVKPVPANYSWKGSEKLSKPYETREPGSSEFTWKFKKRMFKF